MIDRREPWDIAVIGGGATGVGIAVDAAARGYAVCLLEQSDFGKATSSRSTKLVHGGVRYLQQGNIALVTEALHERGILRNNAPHLVHDLAFVVPNYQWWEAPFYGTGLKAYDMLAGKYGFGKSRHLSREEVLRYIPTLKTDGLRGGVLYHDGQFDDARLLIELAATATRLGAALLNYAPVTHLLHDATGHLNALRFTDCETGQSHTVTARCIINATGAFSDQLRHMDNPAAPGIIAPSQGVHLVLEKTFLSGNTAIMVPHTSDGRVLFAVPWHNRTLLGTTDTALESVALEPVPQNTEIDFILETAGQYLARPPNRADIVSMFAGIRPLVKAPQNTATAALSRDHTIEISSSGLLTIAGGKWTTYRRMAEDAVDHACGLNGLPVRECITRTLKISGSPISSAAEAGGARLGAGSMSLTEGDLATGPSAITTEEIIDFIRHEMARTIDDILARRTRLLFLDARAAIAAAPQVAQTMATELARDKPWIENQILEFNAIAKNYLPPLA